MKLIADSGSTKTDWAIIDKKGERQFIKTQGLNPYFVKAEDFLHVLNEEIKPKTEIVREIHFYGSGCGTPQKKAEVEKLLGSVFPGAALFVYSDLFGAARALCQIEKGIACILGTGSNACIYNGEEIVDEAVSLGFILGDEGSGAHLGKQLLTAYLYNELPDDLHEKFIKEYDIDRATILENIYRKPYPSRYLAGFANFLAQNKSHKYVSNLVSESFDLFLTRHVESLYNYNEFKINFVGSLAFIFESILKRKVEQRGLELGEIMNKPIDGLVNYHK